MFSNKQASKRNTQHCTDVLNLHCLSVIYVHKAITLSGTQHLSLAVGWSVADLPLPTAICL